jgi:hypothetical protein
MRRLRTIPGFVYLLVTLFMVAQFSGIVSSRSNTQQPLPELVVAHTDGQHAHHDGHVHDHGATHHHDGANLADNCCALHAYFAGVLPPIIAIETGSVMGTRLAALIDDEGRGIAPGRLDRPPRPLRRT